MSKETVIISSEEAELYNSHTGKIMLMTGWTAWEISRIIRLCNTNVVELYEQLNKAISDNPKTPLLSTDKYISSSVEIWYKQQVEAIKEDYNNMHMELDYDLVKQLRILEDERVVRLRLLEQQSIGYFRSC